MSEIFVDTIRKTGGSLGTDIRIKNTSVYESDGGTSVTQNLVQALAKAWYDVDGSGTPSINDSLNGSSTTDHGTGDFTLTRTNPMSNLTYGMAGMSDFKESGSKAVVVTSSQHNTPRTTTAMRHAVQDVAAVGHDPAHFSAVFHGDLA